MDEENKTNRRDFLFTTASYTIGAVGIGAAPILASSNGSLQSSTKLRKLQPSYVFEHKVKIELGINCGAF